MNTNVADYFYKKNRTVNQYVVKPGDTLYKIAQKYNVSVNDLIIANNLNNTIIYPNQVLIVSRTVPNGGIYFVEYIVKPLDTLEKIALETGVTTEVIGKYNDVTKLVLAEDQVLQIPKSLSSYVILENDTLESILARTQLTLEDFLDLNLSNLLVPGTTIVYR